MIIRTLAAVSALVTSAAAEQLTRDERQRAAAELQASRERFLAAIQELSQEQLRFKSSPDRWSVGDCAQHIAAAEEGYFALIERLLQKAPTPGRKQEVASKDQYVLREMQNRDAKRTAPESLQPGKWPTVADAVAHFNRSRDRLIHFVETTEEDLRGHHQEHRAVGLIDAYQWILLASGHARRHTLQIEEVKADRGFPGRGR